MTQNRLAKTTQNRLKNDSQSNKIFIQNRLANSSKMPRLNNKMISNIVDCSYVKHLINVLYFQDFHFCLKNEHLIFAKFTAKFTAKNTPHILLITFFIYFLQYLHN